MITWRLDEYMHKSCNAFMSIVRGVLLIQLACPCDTVNHRTFLEMFLGLHTLSQSVGQKQALLAYSVVKIVVFSLAWPKRTERDRKEAYQGNKVITFLCSHEIVPPANKKAAQWADICCSNPLERS